MVQRKVPNKLSIQADHVKLEKLLVNLKPSSLQNQEMKNKGADLKKKMKKSGSFKRPEIERVRSTNFRKQVEQPGKPPPLLLPATAAGATPKKQSPSKLISLETTPNYMKATTSSDARKERGQVSSQSAQTSPDSKRSSRRNIMSSKSNSGPGNKSARTLSRTSSLKLVRTLTKTPSFKPSRVSMKKHSPVIICENLSVQKATCSSTMKDHKFPGYLTLSPGATEAEGTSVMKVCPYNYCSLNGHHHEPLPPLKCFLSTRRRMLKAQRSIKLGCLSPRRARPARDIMKEFEAAQVNFDVKPPFDGCNSSSSSPLIQEQSPGFFIEIYSKERDNQDTTDSSVLDAKPFIGVTDQMETEKEAAVESPSNEPITLGIDSNESLHQSKDDTFLEMEGDHYYAEENMNEKIAEDIYPQNLVQVKTKPDFLNLMYELEAESTPSIQSEEADLEASDMDWEAGLYSASYPCDGTASPMKINHLIDLEKANSAFDNALLNVAVFKSDETIGDNCEENLPDEIAQESIDDETASEAGFGDKEAVKKPSLIGEDGEGSEPEDVTSSMAPEVGNVTAQQMLNQEFENGQEMGSQGFENPCFMSENLNQKLKNSIGTQTDSDIGDPCNVSQNLYEVLKRSIGTQTDFEDDQSDHLIDVSSFTDKVPDASIIAEKEGIGTTIPFVGIEHFMVFQNSGEAMEHTGTAIHDESQLGAINNEGEINQSLVNEALPNQIEDCSSATQSISTSDDLDIQEKENYEAKETEESISFDNQTHSQMSGTSFTGNADQNIQKTEGEDAKDEYGIRIRSACLESKLNEEPAVCRIIKGTNRRTKESEETTEFNPRAPNFLPVEPDPEAEKVDLRHLVLDENKNTEEWMIDHALQRAVTKLAPARKRKVALLVEAFETVLPIPKHKTHPRHTSTVFPHVRPIQACS